MGQGKPLTPIVIMIIIFELKRSLDLSTAHGITTMIVCVCHALNDRHVQQCIDDGANSVAKLARKCGAGTDCGACVCELRAMLVQNSAPETRQASQAA